jgi:hypothetical protein
MTTFRARVFENKDGNRYLVKGFWYSDDAPEAGMGSMLTCMTESMLFSVVIGAKPTGWLDVEADEAGHGTIEHFPYRLTGRQFANGSVDVMLIGGPLFDQEMAAHAGATP